MTPTEVWEGFNPVKEPLETSIISSTETDNFVVSNLFFTSETTKNGRVRVMSRIAYDSRWRDPRPAVLLLPSIDKQIDCSILMHKLVSDGYVVAGIDYSGFNCGTSDAHTSYPSEYSYAAYPECMEQLYSLKSSARETPWFQWAKAARRGISMLQDFRLADPSRIAVLGIGHGAQVAWQVAGMDGRVSALIAINGGGYLWKLGQARFKGDSIPSNDFERTFSTGVGAETYAAFATCPVCYILSSNSAYANVDRAGDILSLVHSKSKLLMISKGSDRQINTAVFKSLTVWLGDNLAHDRESIALPHLNFECIENRLYLHLKTAGEPESLSVYVAYDEPHSDSRFWNPLTEHQKVGEHEHIFAVPVSKSNKLIMAFASCRYPDGIMISSPVTSIEPDANIQATHSKNDSRSRILYDGNMGIGAFSASTSDVFIDDAILKETEGPFSIKGITTERGDIVIFKDPREKISSNRMTSIQFDAHSPVERRFKIVFVTRSDSKEYTADIKLAGGNFWQKIILSNTDFKSEDGKTLSLFGDCKKFVISNAENVLFNNILWI